MFKVAEFQQLALPLFGREPGVEIPHRRKQGLQPGQCRLPVGFRFFLAAGDIAGWFVESMWSQTLVIHMIRTPKLPFIQSRASAPLTLLTMTGITVLTIIPFTVFGTMLGFVALPATYFAYLIPCILLYMILATSLKKAYVRHFGELL